jgi:hypothetical protein
VQSVSIMEKVTDLNWSVTLTIGRAHQAESQRFGARFRGHLCMQSADSASHLFLFAAYLSRSIPRCRGCVDASQPFAPLGDMSGAEPERNKRGNSKCKPSGCQRSLNATQFANSHWGYRRQSKNPSAPGKGIVVLINVPWQLPAVGNLAIPKISFTSARTHCLPRGLSCV